MPEGISVLPNPVEDLATSPSSILIDVKVHFSCHVITHLMIASTTAVHLAAIAQVDIVHSLVPCMYGVFGHRPLPHLLVW